MLCLTLTKLKVNVLFFYIDPAQGERAVFDIDPVQCECSVFDIDPAQGERAVFLTSTQHKVNVQCFLY